MKQLLQRLDTGLTEILDVPLPSVGAGEVLVRSAASLISVGTERMMVEFGRAGWIEKARSQPDKVRQVIEKVRTDGLAPTMAAVRDKLAAPIALGYCNAGVVVAVGSGVRSFAVGDRVVTNGPHAEYVAVPELLVAKIPASVSFEDAAFAPLGAIALQGVRLADVRIGETVVVYGLGLIGLLTVQILRAAGCRVIGIDTSPARLAMATELGATAIDGSAGTPDRAVLEATGGIGADAVLLTLASSSDDPVHNAASMSRKRGRIVLVGVTGLHLQRDDFYKKELSFAVSCSYGPGRYDAEYEKAGHDYPIGFVRWTAQRNFEAVLALLDDRSIQAPGLVSHRFAFERAADAYELMVSGAPSLGIMLEYPAATAEIELPKAARTVTIAAPRASTGRIRAAVIGAGNFASRTLIPAMVEHGFHPSLIASRGGTTAAVAAKRFGFERATSDLDVVFEDRDIEAVFIVTRHDTHASLAVRALEAGKHVFVEKPLALTDADIDRVEAAARSSGRHVMVGFNRRFAPLTREMQQLMRGRAGAASLVLTVNAGAVPREDWTQGAAGGGRIAGEGCHFIDLARALVGSPIEEVSTITARSASGAPIGDVATITLRFADGSVATVHYFANGSKAFPKERVECFFDGRILAIDNWRKLERYGIPGPLLSRPRGQDKGHGAEMEAWRQAIQGGGAAPIPLDELIEVSRASLKAAAIG